MKYLIIITLLLAGCADTHRHDGSYYHEIKSKRQRSGGLIEYDVWRCGNQGGCSSWIILTDQDWQLGDRLTIQAHKPNIEK